MMNYKKVGFAIIVFFSFVGLYFLFLIISNLKPSNPDGPNLENPPGLQINSIKLAEPKQDTNTSYFPIQEVKLTFENPPKIEDLEISISPNAPYRVENTITNTNTIVIAPDPSWKEGITTISISQISKSGTKILPQNYVYRLKTAYPANPPAGSAEYNE